MEKENIMVSINCTVYNHEKYLRKCLDGFIMQKTNFKFEVLIHDDASTDASADIIKEYEEKYPEIVKPIYQKENQYSKGIKISWEYQYPRAKGKYIALCEGDDFWTDEFKLQKQYNMLESNLEAVFCTHTVRSVTENGEFMENTHPNSKDFPLYMNSDEWIRSLLGNKPYNFQTSSYFFRTEIVKQQLENIPKFIKLAQVGDAPLMMLFASYGGVNYIAEEMSCYRNQSIGSWSCRFQKDDKMKKQVIFAAIESFKAYDVFTKCKYSDYVQKKCKREEYKILQVEHDYKKMLDKRYKEIFKEFTIKEKVYIVISAYFPWLMIRLKKSKTF